MKLYLSGPITGHSDFKERFKKEGNSMKRIFPMAEILNPVEFCSDIPTGADWFVYMERCLEVIEGGVTHIKMMEGWSDSKGACVEYFLAKALGVCFV